MIGAIVGDIVGLRFNAANGCPSEDFKLFDQRCHPTDVTNMTLAVGEALIEYREKGGCLMDDAFMRKVDKAFRRLDGSSIFASGLQQHRNRSVAEFDKVKERVRRRVAQLARWRKKVVAQRVI